MPFYARAWRQLLRKPGKTLLLTLVLVLCSMLILGTTMVLQETHAREKALTAQSGARLVCTINDTAQPILEKEAQTIAALDGVASVKRTTATSATLKNGSPVTNSDDTSAANAKVWLTGCDDFENDGPFTNGSYRLTDGALASTQGEVVVNVNLAAQNGWQLGDTLQLENDKGACVALKISGFFLAGNEDKQSNATLAQARIENQLYGVYDDAAVLSGDDQITALSVLSSAPEQLDALAASVQKILGQRVDVTTSAKLYEQLAAPLAQLAGVVTLMRGLSVAAAAVIVALLLAMWMRGRQQEMAVYLSLGEGRGRLCAQMLLESFIVFVAAMALACGGVKIVSGLLSARLSAFLGTAMTLQLDRASLLWLLVSGSAIVILAVLTAMLPVLLRSPKTLLSRMEE